MRYYILKRALLVIPSSIFVLLSIFLLYDYAYVQEGFEDGLGHGGITMTKESMDQLNCELRSSLHLDWPIFYVTIHPLPIPRTLNSICSDQMREFTEMLYLHIGNAKAVDDYVNKLDYIKKSDPIINDAYWDRVYSSNDPNQLEKAVTSDSSIYSIQKSLLMELYSNSQKWKSFIPKLSFNGSENRFHRWMINALNLDFGYSILDKQPVSHKVNSALINTLIFTIPAVLSIFLVSILLSMGMSNRIIESITTNVLYLIDSIPLFWLSIVLIIVFSNLGILSWNYATSISSSYEHLSFAHLINEIARHALPILALTLASIPYVFKQVTSTIKNIWDKPYIETARAKGLSRKTIFNKHIFKNAITPIIALFFSYLAFAFGGAFVVEMVFSINGIGKLMADSVLANDLQVVSVIIMYLVIIKMLFSLVSDVVLSLIDPSIKF